jgi:hypothetical protein
MGGERLLRTQYQPLKRPVLVYLERLLLTQSSRSTSRGIPYEMSRIFVCPKRNDSANC